MRDDDDSGSHSSASERARERAGDVTPRSEEEGSNFSGGVADHLRGEPGVRLRVKRGVSLSKVAFLSCPARAYAALATSPCGNRVLCHPLWRTVHLG